MRIKGCICIVFLWFTSCEFFKNTEEKTPIARVNETYLYVEDLENNVAEGLAEADSIIQVTNFINRWATQQLLMQGAQMNLNEDKQAQFDKLVDQYKNDLYTKAYLEALVTRQIDTLVTLDEAEAYYNDNKEVFKLNEDLIKFRYINIDENILDIVETSKKFRRFDHIDKKELDSLAIYFKSYSLNDSIWIKLSQAIKKIPVINAENKNELLKKSNFVQLKDSLGLYLMQINDVLLRNETAPLEYVKPTIDQIVINKRKLELIRELEKDITKDAIKNNQFEIYK